MANPPTLYIPAPAPLVDGERRITRDWLHVFDQLVSRIFATGTVVGPTASVNNAILLADGTTGQLLKSATGTGVVHATSGVYSAGLVLAATEISGVLPTANGGGLSGTYTPTLTIVTNATTATAYACQYLRVGTVVTVSGRLDITPTTTATVVQVGLSLPIASVLTASEQCAGVGAASVVAGQSAAIVGDVTNSRAQVQWLADDVSLHGLWFQFAYQVLP